MFPTAKKKGRAFNHKIVTANVQKGQLSVKRGILKNNYLVDGQERLINYDRKT